MFDTGILGLYHLIEQSTNGQMPTEALSKDIECYYGERTVSFSRLYAAQGANTTIDILVRVPFDIDVDTSQFVVLEDGKQYRIDAISEVIVKSSKRAKELSLVRLENYYDIADTN